VTPGNSESGFVVSLEKVTLRVRDRKLLPDTSWTIRPGEQWAVLGPNGSGKSTLARTVAGHLPSAAGHVRIGRGHRLALVSFERQQDVYARELENDAARYFAGNLDTELTPRELIARDRVARDAAGEMPAAVAEAIAFFRFEPLLDRSFRHLSAGEMRKALVLQALAGDPTLLLLDEPFDGLDRNSRESLAAFFQTFMERGRHIVLVTHRAEEILEGMTHVLVIRDGRAEVADSIASAVESQGIGRRRLRPAGPGPEPVVSTTPSADRVIVDFRNVTIRYQDSTVIDSLSWQLLRGQRWGIFGPNGSGKTTIINLIAGENLQGYANDVRLFGRRRGSGESLWELRRRIGVVTPTLQMGYRKKISALEVVLSGFDGSTGLYRRPRQEEVDSATRLVEALDLADLSERLFPQLSYGQQRLFLIARAMVRRPELLLLDEPCQGLDPSNRARVIEAVDVMAASDPLSLIFVTHHPDEYPACLTNFLELDGEGGAAEVQAFGSIKNPVDKIRGVIPR